MRLSAPFLAAVFAAGCSALAPHGDSGQRALVVPEEVAWRDGPAALPDGAEAAVLEGDPLRRGIFTMRLKFPSGYRVPPHWHPRAERVTVVSGTLLLGMGTHFTRQGLKELPPGSFSLMPPKMAHFAETKEETVVQLTGVGPWEVIYVNPEDDPGEGGD